MAVLLHGRGSHQGDLQALRDDLPDGMVLITPQAPHLGHPWGYGPGWAWYRYIAEDRIEDDTLQASLDALHHFLVQLPGLIPVVPGPVFLGGFSQGGTTSLAYGLAHPERIRGILNFSGFLPAEGLVDLTLASEIDVFWGHGKRDSNIPFALARRGRERLEGAGARLVARDYPIGHWVDPGEMSEAGAWMEARLPE